jgi:hypothetical protein
MLTSGLTGCILETVDGHQIKIKDLKISSSWDLFWDPPKKDLRTLSSEIDSWLSEKKLPSQSEKADTSRYNFHKRRRDGSWEVVDWETIPMQFFTCSHGLLWEEKGLIIRIKKEKNDVSFMGILYSKDHLILGREATRCLNQYYDASWKSLETPYHVFPTPVQI